MDTEQQKYINDQVNNDFILKSKNSAIAFLVITILFLFLHNLEGLHKIYIGALSTGIIVLSIIRLVAVDRYLKKKNTLEESVRDVSFTAVFNAALWCAVGVISVLSYEENNSRILVTFIILIAFCAGSVVTVSHKIYVFLPINILVLFPQSFYGVFNYLKTNDIGSLWIIAYSLIFLVYNIRQGQVIRQELIKRFISEFELKKSLEEVALSKKHLEEESIKTFHASRLSSLGEMAGGVAHEINNPLTIIQGMAKSILVHEELKIDDATKEKLKKINSASDRIAKIVKGMKIISSKNDQIEHETIKVSKVLEISLGLFEERFKNENIVFKLENITDPTLLCNPLQISQILINLISNALDALQKNEGESHLSIKVTEDFLYHKVDIRVINNGPLISSEVSSKIFEPFFSTKALGKGTGLGLSISQTLAHSNGGNLSYEDYEDHVCFKLHLSTYTDA